MGSATRMGGERRENAQAARRRLRKEAAIIREARLLQLYARGERMQEIARIMAEEFGACSVSHLYEVLPRALSRLADHLDQQTVDQARALYVARLEMMFGAFAPRALGIDPDSGQSVAPDPRLGELALKVADRIAEVTGARERPKRGDVTVNINLPDDPATARQRVVAELAAEAKKIRTVEGHLVAVGGDLLALTEHAEENDRMPAPFEEDAA